MSRPFNAVTVVLMAAACVAFQGCRAHTIYRDAYSPKRNYYVPPEEKKEVILPPTPSSAPVTPQVTAPGGAPTVPGGAAAPAPGASPSGIPGL